MKKEYIFTTGDLPADYRCNHRTSVFNGAAYRELQSQTGWHSYHILDSDHAKVKGSAHFIVEGGSAKCPLKAPFGSVDVSEDISSDLFVKFLDYIEDQLLHLGVSKIVIKLAPELYDPERLVVASNFFLTHHYDIRDAEVGAIIPVTERNFNEIIHPRKKRKLQQSRGDGLSFLLLGADSLSSVYDFIAARRQPKKYSLSISRDDLLRTVQRMPKQYPLFAVFHQGEMVAASVTIKVYDNILYHFISDHVRKIGPLSPALVLMEGIYDYCRAENIRLLDLGTSTVDGVPNFKLVKFKTELGAKISHKFTFEKSLSS